MKEINDKLYAKLKELGIINEGSNVRNYNIGASDYSKHVIQPWSIWIDYNLNPFDADIVKQILRTKENTPRKEDYEKIIHICQERIRQIENRDLSITNEIDFENRDLSIADEIDFEMKK